MVRSNAPPWGRALDDVSALRAVRAGAAIKLERIA
jgi:hypothetical protein